MGAAPLRRPLSTNSHSTSDVETLYTVQIME
jgi:hypothetical protein